MKKSLLTVAMGAALGVASMQVSAGEFLDFTVDEASVVGTDIIIPSVSFVADKINGSYVEVLTVDLGFNFTSQAFVSFTSFLSAEGSVAVTESMLGANPLLGGYNMYATFSASGSATSSGFSGASGLFELFIDKDQDTKVTAWDAQSAAGTDLALLGTIDDYKIATSTNVVYGEGILAAPGGYRIIWDDFDLTTAGEDYFVAPDPFYMVIDVTGDFDTAPTALDVGSFAVSGDVSAVFITVPEPTSLALMGLGLLGLGAAARRKKA